MESVPFRELVTDAIRYWEPRRVVYNAVLAVVVLLCYALAPVPRKPIDPDTILFVVLLAVLANVAYCAAYVVDVFLQSSAFRERRQRVRLAVFLIGLIFASILTQFWARGLLT